MKHTLAISLSPNVFSQDVFAAIRNIITPWSYNNPAAVRKLEKWFMDYFSVDFALSYSSGRGALYEILSAYDISAEDEVITQAFTCVALPNAILAVGATPVYVDIEQNLTIDTQDLEKKISSKTKAIIVQYTFGVPADIEKIVAIARKHNLVVIEDCAHGIGINYKEKKLGQFGDVAFFSFGRDKAFSCVFGGMIITNDKNLAKKVTNAYTKLSFPSLLWTAQQLFHPIIFSLVLSLYDFFSLGKMLVVLFQKLHMLSFPVSTNEKKGIYKKSDVQRLPGALASLASLQLTRIDAFNTKREEIASFYIQELKDYAKSFPSSITIPYLRFPILSQNRDKIMQQLRMQHVYIGKWYANIIDPIGVDLENIRYIVGSCPYAENVAKHIINLPTFPRMTINDAKQVLSIVRKYA